MSANTTKKNVTVKKYSNNIYVSPDPRKKLEEFVTEIGYKNGKVMAASAFVRYLIENYGEQAKKKLLNNG
jgi:predicted TPR repeat methyltransferase